MTPVVLILSMNYLNQFVAVFPPFSNPFHADSAASQTVSTIPPISTSDPTEPPNPIEAPISNLNTPSL